MNVMHLRRGVIPIYKKVLRQEMQGWVNEVVNTLAIPLTFFLAFGFGLRGYIEDVDGMPYMTFIAPGLITMTMMLEAYRTGAWGLWLDRWHQRMLDEYRIKPVFTSDILIGEILGGFTVAVLKGVLVGAILFLLAPMTLKPLYVLFYLILMFPGCIFFTCLGAMVGTTFHKPDHIAQSQTIFITPLLYLGGLFFPISAFPEAMLPFIRLLPTTAVFDGGREMLLSGRLEGVYGVVLLISAIASFFFSTWWFNRQLSR